MFCLAPNEYRLCTAERQLDWFRASAIGFDVELREITEEVAALAVQGPTSCRLLRLAGACRHRAPQAVRARRVRAGADPAAGGAAMPIMVSRTGFTGDLGYELWMQPQDAEAVWDALMEVGRTRALRPIGSRALNIARIEAGFILPKVDFVSAEHTLYLGTERSPLELGLAWLVDFDKGHFTGRRALLEEQRRGPRRLLVGLDVEGNKPAHNALLYTERSGRQRSRQRHLRDLVADLQAQSGAGTGGRAVQRHRLGSLGGDLSEPRTGVGAAHGAGARGRAPVLRARQRRRATPPADY